MKLTVLRLHRDCLYRAEIDFCAEIGLGSCLIFITIGNFPWVTDLKFFLVSSKLFTNDGAKSLLTRW